MKCAYASPSLFSTRIFLSVHLKQNSYSRSKTSKEGTGQRAGWGKGMSSHVPKPQKNMS